jgi:hypothetical protein
MKLDRKSLVEALEICKPALATQNRAVELSHYWCDGETIGAYNGRLMILQPFPYDIIGGIPDTALDWLKKVETPEINLTGSGDRITLTAGRASRIGLTLLDASRRIFSPDIALNELGVPPLPLDPDLIAALENVSVSQDKQATAPQKLGVFFHPHDGHLDLYATDDYTITKQRIELSNEFSDSLMFVSHIVVPFGLVDQIIKHKKTKGACLYISDTFIVLYAEPTTIMSSLIECPKMPNFSEIIDSFEAPLIALPEEVVDAVDRLSQIGGAIEVTVNDNNLILASEALGSRAEEQFPLEGSNPGGIVIKLDPKLLKRVIKDRTHIGIKPKGLYATGPEHYIHIMAGLR